MKVGLIKRLFKNMGYKTFALLLAIILWSIIQGEQVIEDNREIVVNIDVPKGYAIRGDQRRVLLATVRGPMVLMTEKTSLEAKIKIPPLKEKKYRVRIDKEDIKDWDDRLHITIHDPYLTLYVDEESIRTIPVRWESQGTPAEGFFIKKKILKPSTVQLKGLKADLNKIHEIATESVDITGISENKSFDVHLVPPEGFSAESVPHESINVSIQVDEVTENKRYNSIPIEIMGSDFEATAVPKLVSVTIQAKPSTLKFVENKELQAFIDLHGLKSGVYEREIRVKIPSDTVLIEATPAKASVTISHRKLNR